MVRVMIDEADDTRRVKASPVEQLGLFGGMT